MVCAAVLFSFLFKQIFSHVGIPSTETASEFISSMSAHLELP